MRQIALIVILGGVLSGCTTIRPGEAGVHFRPFQQEQPQDPLLEGVYSKAPLSKIIVYDTRWQTATERVQIQTSDKLHMEIVTSISYRPRISSLPELHRTLGPDFYETTVKPALLTAVRTTLSGRTHDDVVPQAAELQRAILRDVGSELEDLGIEVTRVVFDDIDYPPQIASAIADQMATFQQIKNKELELALAQRETEVAIERARGRSQTTLAGKDTEKMIAEKDAEIATIRANADAETARIQAEVLTSKYLKLRTIEALEQVANSPGNMIYFVPVGKDGIPLMLNTGR